jgi:hypothetical protein
LGIILSGLIFTWIRAANSLAGQFNKAMDSEGSEIGEETADAVDAVQNDPLAIEAVVEDITDDTGAAEAIQSRNKTAEDIGDD